MTNYIPHYTKKKQILTRRENELSRLIKRQAVDTKLLMAAQRVLMARLSVIKATCAMGGVPSTSRLALNKKHAALLQLSPDDILVEFGWAPNNE